MNDKVPILTYHSLDESGSVISVSPANFRRHMEILRARGFVALSLRRLLTVWKHGGTFRGKPVVLTFDDGFRNVLQTGLPILQAHGFSATVFAIAGCTGRDNDWPGQPGHIPRLPLLSGSELRELAAADIEIGAHSMTHASLDQVNSSQLHVEIVRAKSCLEDIVGQRVRVCAYPYGRANAAARELAAAHYEGVCSVELRTASKNDDRCWLPRIDAYYFRRPAIFRLFGTPLGKLYIGLRKTGRALRHAAAAL